MWQAPSLGPDARLWKDPPAANKMTENKLQVIHPSLAKQAADGCAIHLAFYFVFLAQRQHSLGGEWIPSKGSL